MITQVRNSWRTIFTVAEMTLRQNVMDLFIIFTVLVQPMLIAILALAMLRDKGQEYILFVVVGSGMTGIWSSLLFISGNSINVERWSGTLESLVGMPTSLSVIVLEKISPMSANLCSQWLLPIHWLWSFLIMI